MANFVLIENNQIVEYHDLLPKTWKHISGLNLAKDDEEFLNNLGWYTVNKISIFPEEGKQYIDGYSYKFENNIVYESPIIKDVEIPPPEPPKSPEELFDIAVIDLRVKRDTLLRESDWTQLTDVQNSYSQQWRTNWTNYRQALRDLPNRCISGELNIYELEWPSKPQAANIIETPEVVVDSTPIEEIVPESTSEQTFDSSLDNTQNPNAGE